MERFSADLLEFPALKEVVRRYIGSPLGEAALETVEPGMPREVLAEVLADTAEALDYVRTASRPQNPSRGAALPVRFGGIPDATVAVQKLRIEGASLDGKEIYDLTTLLDRAEEIRSILTSVEESFPRLAGLASQIGDFHDLLHDLAGKVLPDGSVADTASVALNRLRRDIEKQRQHIQDSLERFLKTHQEEGVIQEDFVTIRNERFVVPIVAGQRRRVDGVIHSASGSGRTLFVEPLETIDLNNELVRLTDEEIREVHRILFELTSRLRQHAAAIAATLQSLSQLDLLFAKARFGQEFECVVPRISSEDDRRLTLKEARHPLLEAVLRPKGKRVVPFSVALDEQTHTFLISGPNTGGKTVTMKTVGLLALMAQAGLPVTATEAEVPLFDQVLADIGDNQSIQESLSSFSAHMMRIKAIEQAVTYQSLVLLDELGRATDPEEGGALGVAILDHFRMIGAMTLASTHLLAIKVYGATTQGVLNASMGFDEETLQPTYQLRVGAPGKSAGLDIASRLGLPTRLIERARSVMTSNERDIARFLSELHQRIEENAALGEELRRQEAAVRNREAQLEVSFAKRDAARVRDLERQTEELVRKFEAQAQRTIAELVELAEHRKAQEQALRRVSKTAREFRDEVHAAVAPEQQKPAPPAAQLVEGARVRLKGVRDLARVRRRIGEDRLEVDAGLLKMQVLLDDVTEVLPPAEMPAKLPRNVSLQTAGPKWDISYREINLIGQRAADAVDQVDKFLDDASLAAVDRVRIVHGFGMGILKKAVTELLQKNPHVEKFYPAPPSEGGNGATIVELKAS